MSVIPQTAPPSSSSHSTSLSVYEQERQKNIEKNKAVLAELGLGDARKQLIETHKKDVVEKIKRRYTKKSFPVETPRRSARIQGKPVRYTDGFGSDQDGEDNENKKMSSPGGTTALALVPTGGGLTGGEDGGFVTPPKRKYAFYDIEDEIASRPKYKNELTTCHFCRKRDRKPKTRCGTCGIKYWVGDCCRTCFEQHFEDEDFDEVMMNKNWVCYCCRKKCPCLECIAGITKGRRYGPRKFKDTPNKEEGYSSTPSSFTGVVPDQFSLFSPLPLPSFLNYNNNPTNSIPQFNFPVLPQPNFPPPSPPRPSSPTFAPSSPFTASNFSSSFSPFPSPSLFSSLGSGSNNGSSISNYSGGFPSLHSTFGSMSASTAMSSSSGVSPQNIFGLMTPSMPNISLPPPLPNMQTPATPPSSLSQYMTSSSPSYLSNSYPQRETESLGNGAMCGYKMAQVIAQITNAPTTTNNSFSYLQPSFNGFGNSNNLMNNPTLASINSNVSYINSVNGKKRGRKPKGFNFAFHSSESVSSDPMSNDSYDQPAGEERLPPIKIPNKKRGRPNKNKDLPALSVEEEAMSMNSISEENIDDLDDDPASPSINSPSGDRKKRGRPKVMGLTSKREDMNLKKRGRKPKSLFPSSSPLSETPCSPPTHTPSPSSPGPFGIDDEFFSSSSELLNYDDEMFEMNDMSEFGMEPFDSSTSSGDGTTLLTEKIEEEEETDEIATNPHAKELKVRLKVPSNSHSSVYSAVQHNRKRGRRPKKNTSAHSTKVKMPNTTASAASKEGYEKRKYTKRKNVKDAEDTSNLRRSTRPPQASKAFDDHYLL